ncbi:aldo/keto reductase [Streptomyces sp. NPDC057062]|uniref:aldo/keto reductase n=1 Tax=Streptomyces sp. NPDC057062 TaxID=3346011 RepID=UPI00362ED5C3
MVQMTITLNNGVPMPTLGYGVFQTPEAETAAAVERALKTGYRLIDTAAGYMNERGVGEGIRRSGIPREEVFIETKVWISDYGFDQTLHAFEKSSKKLGVDVIDLLILHAPLPTAFGSTLDAYRALEELLRAGKVKAIGVSNFMPDHLDTLVAETNVTPAVNQVEIHPYFQQREVAGTNLKHGVVSQAWSPIGGITVYRGGGSILTDPVLLEIAEAHGKTSAQVMLRWHIQEGRAAIPKSVTPSRIAENFDVFDFDLNAEEVARIDALETGVRGGPEPEDLTLERSGFVIPEA